MQDRKLFVGGLNPVTDDFRLREFYSQFGTVTDAVVMKDIAGRSRGFGFVTYSDPQMADVACNHRPHEIDGKVVDAKKAVPKGGAYPEPETPVCKIFVGGIRRNIRDDDLFEYFSRFGSIVEAVIMMDKETNQSRGFGFVTFGDTDSVDRVVADSPHSLGGYPIDVKKAVAKDDMKGNRRKTTGVRNYDETGTRSTASSYSQWPQSASWSSYATAPAAATGNYGSENFWNQPPPVDMGFYPNQSYTGGPMRDNPYRSYHLAPPYGR
ncbi:Heterogeneous nuclear ribonucleoprotein A3 [Paragonimus heterotremus]|uniref:Heterogeneous nuclear ribonucleoprotein A3 n=1 Tax=Paragonimus heterotremus TaxID=100268 RepID=A0A8J4WGS1_9TREM|nr:Heterogeneous nuclear ribonucleoprotein A3 [Paragonimus heterotremus]